MIPLTFHRATVEGETCWIMRNSELFKPTRREADREIVQRSGSEAARGFLRRVYSCTFIKRELKESLV